MVNRNYCNGRRKEQNIVARAKKNGYISWRSAQSRGPVDVTIIDTKTRRINFLQCKAGDFSSTARLKLLIDNTDLSGTYEVTFDVV